MDIEGNGPTLIIQVGLGKDDGWGAKQKMQRERMSKTRDAVRPEMARWLGVLVAFPEDMGSIPSSHMAAHNCL